MKLKENPEIEEKQWNKGKLMKLGVSPGSKATFRN